MTKEMIRIIMRLAFTKLIELPPAQLKSYEPWLMRKHIRYCLDHVNELSLSKEEIAELCNIKDMMDKFNRLKKGEMNA